MANGIEVVVHVKEQGYNENELQKAGIEVLCNEELSVQCAIIDKSILGTATSISLDTIQRIIM